MSRKYTWDEIEKHLSALGALLPVNCKLMVVGSIPSVYYHQFGQSTSDIDVWVDGSSIGNRNEFDRLCTKAGLSVNPTEDEPGSLYIQLLKPGEEPVIEVGDFNKDIPFLKYGNLILTHPPAANLIASKLNRASERDIADIVFLRAKFNISREQLIQVIETFQDATVKENALSNLVYLDLIDSCSKISSEDDLPSLAF